MVQAVIMAGGEGSRLRPLTCDRPKPLVPLLNKPVMHHAVELLKAHKVTGIGVTLQYRPQDIIDYFGDGTGYGIEMRYFIEDTPLGTAGSVKNAQGFLQETFVVVSGDALTDFALSEAVAAHRQKKALATLVLTPVDIPLEYGVVITEPDGKIRQFLEKPGWGEVFSDTVNTGIYILEPEVLDFIPPGQKFDFSKDLFPLLLKKNKPIFGVVLEGYWCDIGDLKQYQEAHFAAMDGRVSVNLTGSQGEKGIFAGRGCSIHPTARLAAPVFMGSNCRIGAEAVIGPHVCLGDDCTVEAGASLKRTILWNGIYVGKSAELRGSVVCDKVTLHDRAAVFEGSVIGDRSVIGEDARVRPDKKIWPHKRVDKGVTLDTDLIWGEKEGRSLFGADGVAGRVNISLTPERAVRLGAVFGAALGTGRKVLVSADEHRGSMMLKEAVTAGLMSTGILALDAGTLPVPVHRSSIRSLGAAGGIHIKSSHLDPETVHINFQGGDGAPVARDMERKIENLFQRNDFRRAEKTAVGSVTYMPGLTETYLASLLGLVRADCVRDRKPRIATVFTGCLKKAGPEMLTGLGCQLMNTGQEIGEDEFVDLGHVAAGLSGHVVKTGADMGAVFDSNGEHLVLIDENGEIVDEDQFLALMSKIILETSPRAVVAVPVSASSAIDSIAANHGGRIIRTKTPRTALFGEILKPEVRNAQGPFNQMVITLDALAAFLCLLDYMAAGNLTLAGLRASLPVAHMVTKETACPWHDKGRVMRKLIEKTGDRKVDLVDGVKVYHDGKGWALVLPDPDNPLYHVRSEAADFETAEELAGFYVDEINKLRKE